MYYAIIASQEGNPIKYPDKSEKNMSINRQFKSRIEMQAEAKHLLNRIFVL